MMIFFIIAGAIIVILLCREAILHKGDFFERGIAGGLAEMQRIPYVVDLAANPHGDSYVQVTDPAVDGTLPGDPLYSIMHLEDHE